MREGPEHRGVIGCTRMLTFAAGVDKPFRNPRRMMVFYCAISQEVPSVPWGWPIFVYINLLSRTTGGGASDRYGFPAPSSGDLNGAYRFYCASYSVPQ